MTVCCIDWRNSETREKWTPALASRSSGANRLCRVRRQARVLCSTRLVKKLTAGRQTVVILAKIMATHMIERPDDEFVKALSAAVGFAPDFALIQFE